MFLRVYISNLYFKTLFFLYFFFSSEHGIFTFAGTRHDYAGLAVALGVLDVSLDYLLASFYNTFVILLVYPYAALVQIAQLLF